MSTPQQGGLNKTWTQEMIVTADNELTYVRVSEDYLPANRTELSLIANRVILVENCTPNGWMYGTDMTSKSKGWFPSDYVVSCTNPFNIETTSVPNDRSCHDNQPSNNQNLNFIPAEDPIDPVNDHNSQDDFRSEHITIDHVNDQNDQDDFKNENIIPSNTMHLQEDASSGLLAETYSRSSTPTQLATLETILIGPEELAKIKSTNNSQKIIINACSFIAKG